ncbi:MAG: HmuY family protein [Myxococcota bacterium]
MQASSNPYLYLRFTEDGLVKVPIDDETALESQEWHVAARRYIVRLNSGVSGPSCVQSSMQAAGTYAELNAVPGDAVFMEEAYYDDACAMIEDDSGLSGNPNVLFDPWWEYQPDLFCLSTTLIPWLIELEDGRVVKLVMEGYYGENQEGCNTGAGGQMMSGVLTWRWQFLPTE